VATRAGDFAEAELARAVNVQIRNQAIVDAYLKHAWNRRRAIAFAVDLEHVSALAEVFRARPESKHLAIIELADSDIVTGLLRVSFMRLSW
jgi:superfamily II DNA or RNA helicase